MKQHGSDRIINQPSAVVFEHQQLPAVFFTIVNFYETSFSASRLSLVQTLNEHHLFFFSCNTEDNILFEIKAACRSVVDGIFLFFVYLSLAFYCKQQHIHIQILFCLHKSCNCEIHWANH